MGNSFNFLKPEPTDLLALKIYSERLLLVIISEQFEQDIFREFTNEVTTYMFPSPAKNIEETRNFIAQSRQGVESGDNLQFVVLSATTGEFLGCCGIHGQGRIRTPELGIWLKKTAQGKGYGREAIHTVVNWTKKNIAIDYFTYPVARQNMASRKIPESLGGEVIKEMKIETPTAKILELLVYRIY